MTTEHPAPASPVAPGSRDTRQWAVQTGAGKQIVEADRFDVVGGALWFYNGVNRNGLVVQVYNPRSWNGVTPMTERVPAEQVTVR